LAKHNVWIAENSRGLRGLDLSIADHCVCVPCEVCDVGIYEGV
jgi:hypothetical protein